MKKKFEEMSARMNEGNNEQHSRNSEQKGQPHSQDSPNTNRSENKPVGEYIDFEEVK